MMNQTQVKTVLAEDADTGSLSVSTSAPSKQTRVDRRAAKNIAEWQKFLPQECVEAMIRDGWHRRV